MANGRVRTGFSKPYVALYKNTSGTISYSGAIPLARGVDVSLEPDDSGDSTDFYADNVLAESESGAAFTGATCTFTVDGLKLDAEKMIMGLPDAGEDGWTPYNDKASAPLVGVGWITRYEEEGVVTYVPTVLAKCKFNTVGDNSATSEDSVVYTTQSLTAQVMRGDDADHSWKYIGAAEETEAAAEEALKKKLGVTAA